MTPRIASTALLAVWFGVSAAVNAVSRWLPWATDNAGAVREWWALRRIDDGAHWALLPALLYVEWRIWRERG